jgi:hypothetical protein
LGIVQLGVSKTLHLKIMLLFEKPRFDSRQGQAFYRLHYVQTGSRAHPASYPGGTGGFSPGVKAVVYEARHLPTSSAEVKNGGAIPPLPRMSSWSNA